MNIVDVIKGQLSPQVLDEIGAYVGAGPKETGAAVSAGVPGVLAVLAKLATSGGVESILHALRKYAMGDTGAPPAPEPPPQTTGSDAFDSIFGGGIPAAMVAAVAKFSGMSEESVRKLLNYILPTVLGAVAAQFKNTPVTAQGLTSFFEGQKSNISAALPVGLSAASLAGFAGLGGLPSTSKPALPSWALPVAGLAVVGLLAWYFLSGPKEEPITDDVPVAPASPAAPSSAAPGNPGLPNVPAVLKGVNDASAKATEALESVKDPASADAAVPKLKAVDESLAGVKPLWENLPQASRASVSGAAKENLDKLKGLVDKVMAIPGVGEKIKPTLDAVVAKMTELAG